MRSINSKIMSAFIIINITLTSFFSYFVFWVASSIIEKNYISLTDRTITDSLNRIDMFLDKIDNYSLYIIINPEIVRILTKDYGNNINYPRLFTEQVQNLTLTEGDLRAIHYFSSDGDVYHYPLTSSINSIEDLKTAKLINDSQLEDSKIHWSKIYTQTFYQSDRTQKQKVFSGIRSFKTSFQPGIKGILSIDLGEDTLFEFIKNIKLGESGNMYIINKDGNVISASDRALVSDNINKDVYNIVKDKADGYSYIQRDGKKNLLVFNTSPKTGWKIIASVPLKEVLYQTSSIKVMAVVVGIIVILISSLVSFLISAKITKPIREMTKLVKAVAKGNLDVKYEVSTHDELKDLSDGFNNMALNLKELINKVYVEEIQLKQAQLENLKSKINPHFLYNTLDTIYWMLIIAKQNDIAKLVVALSDMLRYSISKSGDQVTIKEEIKQIDNYLFIQKTRFKDRLQVEYDIEEAVLDYHIMKLIIQPIVENAIKHGLEAQSKNGILKIRGFEKDDGIVIQIIDDGKGMTEQEVENVLSAGQYSATLKKPGIGVNNVNERLKMFYGTSFGLSIESKIGEGTCVNVFIPKVLNSGGASYVENSDS